MKWSDNQLECIQAKNKSIIVSASAGAGKTAVLTQRIVKRCLDDKIDMDHIMALTFTSAAANEMKQRIAASLNQQLNNPDYDRDYVLKQISLLDDATISTIHSFCLNILKKYSYTIGFDTARIDHKFIGSELNIIKKRAFDITINNIDKNKLFLLLQTFSTRMEDDNNLSKASFQLLRQALMASEPVVWLKQLSKNYPINITQFNQLPDNILQEYHNLLAFDLNNVLKKIQSLKASANQEYLDKNIDRIELLEQGIIETLKVNETKDYNELEIAFKHNLARQCPGSSKLPDENKTAKKITAQLTTIVNSYMPSLIIKTNNAIAPVIDLLVDFTVDLYNNFNLIKQQENGIDFNDMEILAYQILKENNDIALNYQNFFHEVCVDEFQDTSIRQNDIISMCAKKEVLFRVGDIKQSIYRFRGGEPGLMLSLLNDKENKTIVLDENYRSSASIIEFTNQLFAKCFNVAPGLNKYSDQDIVKPGTDKQKESYLPIEFYGLDMQLLSESDKKYNNKNIAISSYIAYQIQEGIKNSKFNHYRDYCVLVKSHSSMIYLQKQFEQANIPYYMDLKSGFSSSNAITLIKSFLNYILDANNQIAITSILTSHIFNYDVNSLYQLKDGYDNIAIAIKETNHPLNIQRDIFKNTYKKQGIHALIQAIYNFNDLYLNSNYDDKFNYDYLLDFLYSNNYITTINDVLNMLDETFDQDSSEVRSVGKDEDVVNVMTIHQSKGLQFNVVLLYSNTELRDNENKEAIRCSLKYGLGIKAKQYPYHNYLDTIQNKIVAHYNQLDDLAEQLRVLYVALTRPKEKLIIVDAFKNNININPPYTYTDLLDRIGFSQTILKCIDNPQLFNYIKVGQPFTIIINKKTTTEGFTIKKYNQPLKEITTDSASKNIHLGNVELLKNSNNSDYGTKIHETIAALDDNLLNIEYLKTYDTSLTNYQIKALDTFGQKIKLFKQEHDIHEVYKELPFIVKINDSIHNGSIDYLAVNDHQAFIIDHKTTNATNEQLIDMYKNQLDFYSQAVSLLLPDIKEIYCYIYSFHNNCFVEII